MSVGNVFPPLSVAVTVDVTIGVDSDADAGLTLRVA